MSSSVCDSMLRSWPNDDRTITPDTIGNVKNCRKGFWEDAMTSSSVAMVASQPIANHKLANKHVTIGDTSIIVTSDKILDTRQTGGKGFDHHSEGTSSTTTNTAVSVNVNSVQQVTETHTHSSRRTSDTERARHPREEYYDVIHPEPRDQTYDQDEDLFVSRDQDTDSQTDLWGPYRDDPHVRYIQDPYTGWPLKRSESLESRDNPFLPGGELSREAEALLSRATIIRDQFYLNDEERRALREHELQQQRASGRHVEIVDQLDDHVHTSGRPVSSTSSTETAEDRIMPQSAANTSAAAVSSPNGGESRQHQPRENGKMKGASISPDSDKLTDGAATSQSGVAPTPGGGAAHSSGGGAAQSPTGGDLQVHDLGKKKRKNCCSVM